MGGAVQASVGDGRVPFVELGLEIHEIHKRPSGQEVPFQILHPRFDFALGLRPIGTAHTRLKAPIVRKGFERRIPEPPSRFVRITHRPWAIIEMLARMATKMLKGPFVRLKKLRQALIGTGVIESATAEAQCQHEHMHDRWAGAKRDQRLAPINLTLLPWWRLKPEQRPVGLQLDLAQWGHSPFHRLITTRVAATRPQFLIENPCRVIHLRRAVPHKVGMGR
jgi:hypothetical protein